MIAAQARTSKQAIYRRYKNKTSLIAAALQHQLDEAGFPPPQRSSVADDLRRCLASMTHMLQDTALGDAMQALMPYHRLPAIKAVLEEAQANNRLALRQILIATPFENKMETRIDLLLGLVYFRLLVRGIRITDADIEAAIYLVLGLVAPRGPDPLNGMPGR